MKYCRVEMIFLGVVKALLNRSINMFTDKEMKAVCLDQLKLVQKENDRLQHLTTVLIDHIWKSGKHGLPLKDIDRQMELFDKKQDHVYRDVLSGEKL